MKFFDKPTADVVNDIQSDKTSASDVVTRALDLIASRDGGMNAFITVMQDAAAARAKEIDAMSAAQKKSLPLCGIPVAVKDNICVANVKTTCSSRMLENFVAPYNATVIDALENAGAVIVGKTNLDEFAMGSASQNTYFKPVHNPHDTKKIPGGSSGGSAAAVGAGVVPAALGTDTGGSIRLPASHCGAVGLKPTYGRVSRYGAVAFASSLDQIGPITSDVRDAGLLLSVLSVDDPKDSTNARKQFLYCEEHYDGDVSNMTFGMPAEYFGDGLSDEVRASLDATIADLKNRGAKFVDISLPNLQYAIATYYIVGCAEASSNLARFDGVKYGFRADGAKSLMEMYAKTRAQGFGAEVKRRVMLGTYVLASGYYDAYYLKAARVRTLITNDFDAAWKSCDVIIAPVSPVTAPDIGGNADPLQEYLMDIYTVSANLATIPAISVPVRSGSTSKMPVGVQFMAPKWREDLLMKAGFAAQSASGM